mgnify:CR=1 FL=1
MRLLIATPLYPPESGGPATYVKILEERFPGIGIEVEVVPFSSVRRLPKLLRHFFYFVRIFKALRNADALLALDPVSVGLPSYLASRILRKRFFIKVVGDYAWEQGRQRFGVSGSLDRFVRERQHSTRVRILQYLEALVAMGADHVLVPSHYLKKIVTTWSVPAEKITVIANGIKKEMPAASPEDIAKLPRPLIVTAARLVPWKGVGGLIDAVAELRAQGIPASLVVVGEGPYREHLETYAKARLESEYVFTGALSHAETLAVMSDADVFALNTAYEGLSHVLIEAMGLGAAIVTTSAGGNTELITDDVEGLVVAFDDRPALAGALRRILTDSALRDRVSESARQKSADFTEDAMIEKTAAFLKANL